METRCIRYQKSFLLWGLAFFCCIGTMFVAGGEPPSQKTKNIFDDPDGPAGGAPGNPTPPAQPDSAKPPVAQPANPQPSSRRTLVFLIDASTEAAGALPSIKRELVNAIVGLRPGQEFSIYYTQGATDCMTPDLALATEESKARALADLERIQPAGKEGGLARGIAAALHNGAQLTYVLLRGNGEYPGLADEIARINLEHRMKINAMIFTNDPDAPGLRAAEQISKEGGGVFKRIDHLAAAPADAHPDNPTSPRAVQSGAARETDNLLKLVDLDRDVVRGIWNRDGESLKTDGIESVVRIPYVPPAEYDVRVDFTVSAFGQVCDLNVLCSQEGHPFVNMLGGFDNRYCIIGAVGDTFFNNNPTHVDHPGVFVIGKRQHEVIQVRRDSVHVLLDDELICQWSPTQGPLSFKEGPWVVGCNVLGLGSNDEVTYHTVTIKEVQGHGRIIERHKPGDAVEAVGGRAVTNLKTLSLLTLTPVATQIGHPFALDQIPEGDELLIDGKPCKNFLFAHAPSSLLYNVPAGAVRFRAIGAFTHAHEVRYQFVVRTDGETSSEAFVSRADNPGPIPIDVAVPPGARQIELSIVTADGSNIWGHTAWAEPEFVIDEQPSKKAGVAADIQGAATGPTSKQAKDALATLSQAKVSAADRVAEGEAAAQKQYLADLQRALDGALKTADLPAANWIREEASHVKAGEAVTKEKPKYAPAGNAWLQYRRTIGRVKAESVRAVESARKRCIIELEAAKRTALAQSKDLDEANLIQAEIKRLGSSVDQ